MKRKRSDSEGGSDRDSSKRYKRTPVTRQRSSLDLGETKYFDTFKSAGTLAVGTDWTGSELDPATLNTLFCPGVGAGVDQRIGRKVYVHKLSVNGCIIFGVQANLTALDDMPFVRLALVQDTQSNGVQMQGEQVFAPADPTNTLTPLAFQTVANFGKFKVLKDKFIQCPMVTTSYDGTNMESNGYVVPFKWTIKFKNPVCVKFNSTGGSTIADIVDNSWHIIGTAVNGGINASLHYNARTYYRE